MIIYIWTPPKSSSRDGLYIYSFPFGNVGWYAKQVQNTKYSYVYLAT